MRLQVEFDVAVAAAKKAGARLHEIAVKDLKVLSSEGRDIKLQEDHDAEKVITETLGAVSDIPVLAEESGESDGFEDAEYAWVIDPLDGTFNFSRGIPFCCVSIGLLEKGTPVLGVVYDFNCDECFSGVVGEGAWCNGKEMSVSKQEEASKAVLATGFPVNSDLSTTSLQSFLNQAQSFKKIRLLGSAALALAYTAAGRVDAYTEEESMLWDVAAGIALVQAAGGWVNVRLSERIHYARTVFAGASSSLYV